MVALRSLLEPVLKQAVLLGSGNQLIPNQKTINAMKEARLGQLKPFKTVQSLMDDLNNEDN